MKRVIIYTDGACSGNPGPGGWAAILKHGSRELVLSGSESHTTNNRMELRAVIEALANLKGRVHALVHTDSAYVARGFTDGWVKNWQRNGWKNSKKKPVENQDLWKTLVELESRHKVEWVKVKGHADDPLNNRVDGLAVEAMNQGRSD